MEENRRRNIYMIPGKLSYLHLASDYVLKMVTTWYSLLEQPKTFLNTQQQKKIQSHSNTQPSALKSHSAQLKPKQNVPYVFHDHVLQTSHPTNPGGWNPIQQTRSVLLKQSTQWLVITREGKANWCNAFHPTINHESCRVIICLVKLAAVFPHSISRKGRAQEHKRNKGQSLF